jgi:hydroxypyruvate isomerase
MPFSANTGFLWPEEPFLGRIRAARAAGFAAVEFHDEAQAADPAALSAALAGLAVASLNVRMGASAGRAAIPGAEAEARADLAEALAVAERVDAAAIHVLAGRTDAPGAHRTFVAALRHALGQTGRAILIEPICRAAMPGYFLHDLDQARAILAEIDHPRLKLMFDCYHVETAHGRCLERFRAVAPLVGHVQIASVPDRAEPDAGALDYRVLLPALREAGYAGAFGCEYRPRSTTAAGLSWRAALSGAAAP